MQIALFCHSILSDWNHGNAHFLRGVSVELMERGHALRIFEPRDGWSMTNLVAEQGKSVLEGVRAAFPYLAPNFYDPETLDLDQALDCVDLVLVHEWSAPDLVRRIGEHRARARSYRVLFHDTHHRAITQPEAMRAYDLSHYDGVLAFGEVLRALYMERGWAARAWTWHEAADTRIFRPLAPDAAGATNAGAPAGDVVWIGNWGDDERTAELHEFLLEPMTRLGLRGRVHGVRYPPEALSALAAANLAYGGWLPNHRVPHVFASFRSTVHIPRRPYVEALPGIPTIRPFEALACGIPLVSSPWSDVEGLFSPGEDYLVARSGAEMQQHLRSLMFDASLRRALAEHGLQTIRARHTCAHRVDALLAIADEIGVQRGVSS
ncbi:glycosyltransferase [Pendulispora albinea]|uniref:Glycosyltransferase n=1 Tax=Pendulispora albinea TaxID=2741071 RepID=A0ABZ2LZR5_9BACT